MLELNRIQFHNNGKVFKKETKKMIKFAYKNSVSKSQNACIFVDKSVIKWEEGIRIPEIYGEDIEFEIVDMHQFGYNPQELQMTMHGTINIKQKQKEGEWKVYSSSDEKKQSIGYLALSITKISKQTQGQKTTQILIRNVKSSPDAAYIMINNGKKVLKSKLVKSIKGQFIYHLRVSQNQFIKSIDKKDGLIIEFYSQDNEIIGKCKFQFKDKDKNRISKEDLMKDGKKVGEAYIDFNLRKTAKSQQRKTNDTETTAGNSKISIYKLRSMSESILTKVGQTQFLGKSRQKRMSIIQTNGDIVFPTQKRFMIYEDKPTNIISYSKLPSMKYQDPMTKRYYRGASIGAGTKYDFTHPYKYNPGVGQYKLPSIFDRY